MKTSASLNMALSGDPMSGTSKALIFKSIMSPGRLAECFQEAIRHTVDGKVHMQTDMRAHCNPSRMRVIAEAATELAHRLAAHCPACDCPGWGRTGTEPKLPCSWCGEKTTMVRHEIFGCPHCQHEAYTERCDALTKADPGFCSDCNP